MCSRREKVRKTAAFTLLKCKKQFMRVYALQADDGARVFWRRGKVVFLPVCALLSR